VGVTVALKCQVGGGCPVKVQQRFTMSGLTVGKLPEGSLMLIFKELPVH